MKDDDRLVNAIIDLHQEITGMRSDMNSNFEVLTKRVEKLEVQMIVNNKAVGELRLSVMRLAQQSVNYEKHEKRIRKMETVLARNKML